MPMLSALDRCLICGDYSGVLALGWRLDAVDMVCRSLYFTREYLPGLHFSPRGEAKCVRGPSGRGASRLARAGVLDSTLSTASKRNEVLAVVSCASTVGW